MSRLDSNDSLRVVASPRARRAMRERGIDPRSVRGSGPGGRIVEADIERAAVTPGDQPSSMRRAIARVTTASAANVPQFHLHAELDAAPLLATRARLLEAIQSESRVRLSITDLMLRAMGLALRDNPTVNAIWADGVIQKMTEANVGLVVNLDDGLLIPTLRAVDCLGLADVARGRTAMTAAARAGRLSGDALRGAATSLSNLGTTRVDDFSAVIFPPQSTLLAAGRIVERPFVVDSRLIATPTLRLTLAVDHRVLDGAPAAQFLGRIVRYLEQPELMVDALRP